MSEWSRGRRLGFSAILVVTMAASTFALTSFSVLGPQLIEGFQLAHWQLGVLVTATAIAGAISSPLAGRLSDRLGGRASLLITLGLSSVMLAGIAIAPLYGLLVIPALGAGVAQSIANPATNKLISLHFPAGGRGLVTGVKQSGVQVGVTLGGLVLPFGADAVGWRRTLLFVSAIPASALLAGTALVPAERSVDRSPGGIGEATIARTPFILRLALYGLLVGAGWGAVFTYLPDFAQSALGWAAASAGALVSLAGLFGIAGRIGWSWLADRRLGSGPTLAILAGLAVVAAAALLLAPVLGGSIVWLAAALFGASAGAWNAVGMLAVINELPSSAAGEASGIVLFGFLIGLGLGPPPFGWSVDVSGGYSIGLTAVLLVLLAAFVVGRSLAATRQRYVVPADS